MKAVPAVIATLAAAAAWAVVGLLLVESSDVLRPVPVAPAPALRLEDDPCVLRQPLPVGTEARCEIPLAREGAAPLIVELKQEWLSTNPQVLAQRLTVREPTGPPITTLDLRSAQTASPARILRLARVPVGPAEHLAYITGLCGGASCGTNELVVLGPAGNGLRELLRVRLGAQADLQTGEAWVSAFEGAGPPPQGRLSPRIARTYAWLSGRYVNTVTAEIATPQPSPTAR